MKPLFMIRHLAFMLCAFFSVTSVASASEGKQIIERMTEKLRGRTNTAVYEITVSRPSWKRSLKIEVSDDRKNKRLLLHIQEPPKEKGVSFLRIQENLWSYLPSVEKVIKIPPSLMLQPWMGSDFSNDDLVKESSYIDDYTHQIVGEETRQRELVKKIELLPKEHAAVVWGKIFFWVRTDDLPVEEHFLDENGRVIKTLLFSDFQMMDGILLPTQWTMTDQTQKSRTTTLRLMMIDFDPSPPFPDSLFSQQSLRSP